MKVPILVFCLVASIYANRKAKYDFNIVYEKTKFGETSKFHHLQNKVSVEQVKKILTNALINPRGITSNLNDYADKVFVNIDRKFSELGLDPFEMPDIHTGFNFTFLFIPSDGELDLTRGWLYDIDTVHREGDVIVDYETNTRYLEVAIPMAFNDLQFDFDYSAKLLDIGPTGELHGKITNVAVGVKIGYDFQNFVAYLDEFYILNSGHIDVSFTGNGLLDWVFDILSEVVTTLLKEAILLVVEDVIRGGLEDVISIVNNAVDELLNGTSPDAFRDAAHMALRY